MIKLIKLAKSKVNYCLFKETIKRTMSVFTQKLNPITGTSEWITQNENYDYHQEVARSAFADMLHDTERNQLYEKALKIAIQKTHTAGKKANVLDIGTGTGLLSMMAVRNGADSVTACEAFEPMGKCALRIIKDNGFDGKIRVIPKRSTELTVGEGGDLAQRCNILVTEVFDTELIGEGAFSTFSHAHKVLLEKECIVVPNTATIFAQVVECPVAQQWNKLKDFYNNDGEILISTPDSIKNCVGSASVHDIQLSQMPQHFVNTIISPVPVFRFDWSGKTPFVFERSTIQTLKSERDGQAQAVFMWWELEMDTENKVILSCAPFWAHRLFKERNIKEVPWRDHWMQAVYYLPKPVDVKKDEELCLISCHDEYSLWFNLKKDLKLSDEDYVSPICDCGLHVAYSRTRIGQINNSKRNKAHIKVLEENISSDSTVLILSDGFFLGLASSKFGAKKTVVLETNHMSKKLTETFVKHNNLSNVEVISNISELKTILKPKEVSLVISEPYFVTSIIPWDNLLFAYLLQGVREYLADDVKVFPNAVVVKGIAVQFDDLHKIRSPLNICEGFIMKEFDHLIEESSDISDDKVEAQPLWEYPATALSNVVELINFDMMEMPQIEAEIIGYFDIKCDKPCNGIALWVDWVHENSDAPKNIISTGPTFSPEIGKKIDWDIHTRQGVYLFESKKASSLGYSFKFNFNEGNISFNILNS